MSCYKHPDSPVSAFCRTCGRPICTACQRAANGTVYCPEHVPAGAQGAYPGATIYPGTANPYASGGASLPSPSIQAPSHTSPALAFVLGFIPGVGAIYNGQYLKGLVHAGIFGLLITLLNGNEDRSSEPFFGLLMAAFIFYMPFEAYHTAKKRQLGYPVDEWSSLSRGGFAGTGRTAAGPIILIAIGVLFLLNTMNLIEFRQIGRFWPVLLIGVGAARLYGRVSHGGGTTYDPAETTVRNAAAQPPMNSEVAEARRE